MKELQKSIYEKCLKRKKEKKTNMKLYKISVMSCFPNDNNIRIAKQQNLICTIIRSCHVFDLGSAFWNFHQKEKPNLKLSCKDFGGVSPKSITLILGSKCKKNKIRLLVQIFKTQGVHVLMKSRYSKLETYMCQMRMYMIKFKI